MRISADERLQGQLSDEHLAFALRAVRTAGYLIIESVLCEDLVAALRRAYDDLGRPKHVPDQAPFYDPQLIANPIAMQVMTALMGRKIFFSIYSFKCVDPDPGPPQIDPGAEVRGVHRDGNHLFPEYPHVLPVSGIYVDIPLVDFTSENGATRIWPGSHLIIDQPPDEIRFLPERARTMPSLQAAMPAGSLLVRDQRTWHAAAPNRSDQLRIMLDMGYFRAFQHYQERIRLAREIWEEIPGRERKLLRVVPED